jgi:TonB family protein
MKRLCFLFAMLACTAVAAPPKAGPRFETDSGTVGFLHRYFVSGANIQYPHDARRLNLQGGGFFLMKLRPDGSVESLKVQMSTGYSELDEYVKRTLRTYRFRPGTKGQILWLVSFIQPATVVVKITRIKEQGPPPPPRKE